MEAGCELLADVSLERCRQQRSGGPARDVPPLLLIGVMWKDTINSLRVPERRRSEKETEVERGHDEIQKQGITVC